MVRSLNLDRSCKYDSICHVRVDSVDDVETVSSAICIVDNVVETFSSAICIVDNVFESFSRVISGDVLNFRPKLFHFKERRKQKKLLSEKE